MSHLATFNTSREGETTWCLGTDLPSTEDAELKCRLCNFIKVAVIGVSDDLRYCSALVARTEASFATGLIGQAI
ncbi:MAG: hypothetical protein ACXVIW_07005 [Halobacteriota archaeon]